MEARRDDFFEAIRDRYPLILVPGAVVGVAPPLQHYRFEQEDSKAGVSLALHSLTYFQREYEGATAFNAELLRIFDLANRKFRIRKFSRIGWRYINAIPFAREENLIPLTRYFRNPPKFFALDSHGYERVNFQATTPFEDVSILVRLESDSGPDKDKEVLIFDIDVYKTIRTNGESFASELIPALVERLHRIARNFFEDSITDAYRTYLTGGAYE